MFLAKRPDDPGATLLLGLVREKDGDYASAAQLLDSQFEFGDFATRSHGRVVSCRRSKVVSVIRLPKIIDVLKLHANDRLWIECHRPDARKLLRWAEICKAAEVLFALIPDDDAARPAAGLQLAKLLYSRDQVSQAKELLLQLAEHGVVSADLQALLGNCFESEHQPDLALQAYQRAIDADPSRIDYYEDLISLLLDLRKTNDAIALVNHALTIAPNDARPWVWKGKV